MVAFEPCRFLYFRARQHRDAHNELAAWRAAMGTAHGMYRCWLPAGSYEPADLPALEIFRRLPAGNDEERSDLDACIPSTSCRAPGYLT